MANRAELAAYPIAPNASLRPETYCEIPHRLAHFAIKGIASNRIKLN